MLHSAWGSAQRSCSRTAQRTRERTFLLRVPFVNAQDKGIWGVWTQFTVVVLFFFYIHSLSQPRVRPGLSCSCMQEQGGGCLNMCLVRSLGSLNTSGMLKTDAEVGEASGGKWDWLLFCVWAEIRSAKHASCWISEVPADVWRAKQICWAISL